MDKFKSAQILLLIFCVLNLCLASTVLGANQMATHTYSFTIVADLIAPSAVSDLSVTDSTHNSVTLGWSAPGDDGTTGTATSYELRYSTSVINDGNWLSATTVSGEPTPGVAGTAESIILSGLSADTTYYFAIKTQDDNSNVSGLSNVATVTTASIPDTTAPYVNGHAPSQGASNVAKDTDIIVHVCDDGEGVDISTIVMKVNGVTVTPTITGTSADYILTYSPGSDFNNEEVVTVTVEADDLAE